MSETLEDPAFDALIDEAARSLTAAPSPDHLRTRVFARLEAANDRWWKTRWLIPAGAIAGICIAAVAVYEIRLKPDPTAPVNGTASLNPTSSVGSGSSRDQSGTDQSALLLTPDATAFADSTTPPPPQQMFTVVQAPLPDGIESIAEAGIAIDPIGGNELTSITPMTAETMSMAPLEVDALAQ